MDIFLEIAKAVLPSLIVFLTAYLMFKSFMEKESLKSRIELKIESRAVTLPLRIQAYERVCLFLERITPNLLIHRINNNAANAIDLQRTLLSTIRKEFEHNLSQQIYMSPTAWNLTVKAKEDLVNLVIMSGKGLNAQNTNMDFIKAITEKMIKLEESPTKKALEYLKEEFSKTI